MSIFDFWNNKSVTETATGIEPGDDGEIHNAIPVFDDVLDGNTFTGIVVTSHNGYCFIGNVRRGYQTIATNGDIFCPQTFSGGAVVQFLSLSPDPQREGKFRTEYAVEISTSTALARTNEKAEIIKQLSANRSAYHATAKRVNPELAELAAFNRPFEEAAGVLVDPKDDMVMYAENVLRSLFHPLESMGVSFNINDEKFDLKAEQERIDGVIKRLGSVGQGSQSKSVRRQYDNCAGVRSIFSIMYKNGILSKQAVLPNSSIADFLVAAPVWFTFYKEGNHRRFLSNLGGTKEFSWLWQMYNLRTREIRDFNGRDIMPLPLVDILAVAQKVFDFVVIATPYHDLVTNDWKTPTWARNIDPYLLGFFHDIPFIFAIGRWSGTGLLPMVCDMVADTMDHIYVNKQHLQNIPQSTQWVHATEWTTLESNKQVPNTVLKPFAEQLLSAYEQGVLFDLLKGKVSASDLLVKK